MGSKQLRKNIDNSWLLHMNIHYCQWSCRWGLRLMYMRSVCNASKLQDECWDSRHAKSWETMKDDSNKISTTPYIKQSLHINAWVMKKDMWRGGSWMFYVCHPYIFPAPCYQLSLLSHYVIYFSSRCMLELKLLSIIEQQNVIMGLLSS